LGIEAAGAEVISNQVSACTAMPEGVVLIQAHLVWITTPLVTDM